LKAVLAREEYPLPEGQPAGDTLACAQCRH
jgi:hypothetical protein